MSHLSKRTQIIILVIVYILLIPLIGLIGYCMYLDSLPPPELSPMQKQTGQYDHYSGFPWENVYIDAVGVSDWCFHIMRGRSFTDYYYYEVVTSDQSVFLVEAMYNPMSFYEDLRNGEPYRIIGNTKQIKNKVLEGVAELKGMTVEEVRDLYGYRCLAYSVIRTKKLSTDSLTAGYIP